MDALSALYFKLIILCLFYLKKIILSDSGNWADILLLGV